jgi:broad specificity polyphosphatase/5'/3'-nucleotidase SurE
MRQEEASQEGSDLWAVERGLVSITPLDLDLTHDPTSHALAKLFS